VRFFQATLIAEDIPAYLHFGVDYRVLAYLVAITIGTGILFGLAPALRLSRLDINPVLKDGSPGASAGSRARYLSSLFVVTEMALAFVLLVGAGLMIRSFLKMARTPMGVRTDHLMSMDILLCPRRYPTAPGQISFFEQLKARLQALPGVQMVGMASNLPGDGWTDSTYELEGAARVDPRKQPHAGAAIVDPGYFPVLEIHPRRGRLFFELNVAPWPAALAHGRRRHPRHRPERYQPGCSRPAPLSPLPPVVAARNGPCRANPGSSGESLQRLPPRSAIS
jgi:hypothetical protein